MFISNLGLLSIFCSLRYLRYRPNHCDIFSLERDFNFTDSKMDCIGCNWFRNIQYIPRNMHTVFALLCFVVVIHWLIFPYPPGLLHWHCGNLTIAPVPAKQPWWIWINTSCEFIMNDCTTTTKQSTTKPCAYFLGYTVWPRDTVLYIVKVGLTKSRTYCCEFIETLNAKWVDISCN